MPGGCCCWPGTRWSALCWGSVSSGGSRFPTMRNAMPWAMVNDQTTLIWGRVAHRAVYGLLALLAGVPVLLNPTLSGETLSPLGLLALAAVWILFFYTLRPAWRVLPLPMAVFFVGLFAII